MQKLNFLRILEKKKLEVQKRELWGAGLDSGDNIVTWVIIAKVKSVYVPNLVAIGMRKWI